jgi:hypothetical protein
MCSKIHIRQSGSIPTIANGHVYVGAKREVDVYGLPAKR